jgi:hypothetical protein
MTERNYVSVFSGDLDNCPNDSVVQVEGKGVRYFWCHLYIWVTLDKHCSTRQQHHL